jgi:multiple sugar transport system permease protein
MSVTHDAITDVPPSVTAAAEEEAAARPARQRKLSRTEAIPLIDRYAWYEVVAIYAGIFLFLFFLLAPFIEGFLVSLKPLSQLFSSPYRFIPENASFAAYVTMWQSVPGFARYIFNSIFISSVATAIVLLVVVPAAYAFSRFNFRGAGLVLGGFLAVNMFSGAVLIIPLFRLMRSLGILNTYAAMIVPGVAFLIPSAIWLLRTYMIRIPKELHEAAYMDGAGYLYTLRRVILPIAMPGIIVVAITTFIGAYAQQFIFALTFNSKTEFMPLPVGLFAFFGKQEVVWNELMAASFVGIAPALIVIFFLQRYLVGGLTAGAVKQ